MIRPGNKPDFPQTPIQTESLYSKINVMGIVQEWHFFQKVENQIFVDSGFSRDSLVTHARLTRKVIHRIEEI